MFSRTVLALFAVALLASPVRAQPEAPRPVSIAVSGVFGNDAVLGDGYDALQVTAQNRTSTTIRGHVQLLVRQWQQPDHVTEVPLDLPGGESRRAIVNVFVSDSATVEARYLAESGGMISSASLAVSYGQSARALVVLADPPRLRGALLDMTTNVRAPSYGYGGGGTTASGVPLGVVTFDARTGDPILPTSALGWASVCVVVASAPTLARLDDDQSEALAGWVHAGGRLVVFPRTDADFAMPLLRARLPGLHRGDSQVRVDGQSPIAALECGAAHRETFGCSVRVGFGALYVTDFDGTAPPYVELPSTRALLSALVDQTNGDFDSVSSSLTYGRHSDELSDTYGYYGGAQRLSFSRLRAALDPNEGYRPALVLIGILLFLYVIVVGPLNFWWVGRRKTPTLALLTTPVMAFACTALMFLVGYVGKGVLMRYRRVEIVEAVDGDAVGDARRYTGYYFTRPATMETNAPDDGGTFRLLGGSGGTVHEGDTHQSLQGVTGSLWETVFTREEHQVDLGTGISFVLDQRRLASVHNGSAIDLHSVFVVDAQGIVYVVGDVPAGGDGVIPRDGSLSLPSSGYYDVNAADVATLRDALGLARDESAYALGIVRVLGAVPSPMLPVLYAQMTPDAPPSSTPTFAIERDVRILRVVPDLPLPPVYLATGSIVTTPPGATPEPAANPLDQALQNFFGPGATGVTGGAP